MRTEPAPPGRRHTSFLPDGMAPSHIENTDDPIHYQNRLRRSMIVRHSGASLEATLLDEALTIRDSVASVASVAVVSLPQHVPMNTERPHTSIDEASAISVTPVDATVLVDTNSPFRRETERASVYSRPDWKVGEQPGRWHLRQLR